MCIKEKKRLKESEVKDAQACLTLCNPMDYTVHGILQARILECDSFPFSRESSQPRDWIQVSRTTGDSLPAEPQGKPLMSKETLYSLLEYPIITSPEAVAL